MGCQLVEPEVALTDIIRLHLAMGLKIIDQFSADQKKELEKYTKLVKKKESKRGVGSDSGVVAGGGGSIVDILDKPSSGSEMNRVNNVEQETSPATIPFKTISFLHKTLVDYFNNKPEVEVEVGDAASCPHLEAPCSYLHEVLRGSTLHIPELPKPQRNPELEARCQRLKYEQQERAYQQMVTNVSASTLSTNSDWASEFSKAAKSTSNTLIVVFNIFLTVVAAFFFGFFASKYALPTPSLAAEALVGVIVATVVAVADLYFLIRGGF